jgi:hypothetical protein
MWATESKVRKGRRGDKEKVLMIPTNEGYAGTSQDWSKIGPFFCLGRANPCSEPDDWLRLAIFAALVMKRLEPKERVKA